MRIIAGLGNPERKYEHTKHNTGFEVIDILSDKWGINADAKKHRSLEGRGTVENEKVILLKPQTYMNLSGEAIGEAARFYKIPADHVLVVSDEISLPLGRLRVRTRGSAGGHNGLKNIIAQLGTDEFPRVRIGVGSPPHPDYDMADWVLAVPRNEDAVAFSEAAGRAAEAVACYVTEGPERAMNRFN